MNQSPRSTTRFAGLQLWLIGAGMVPPATWFVARYPLRGHTDSLTDIGKLSHYGAFDFWMFVGGIALFCVVYLLGLRCALRVPARRALPPILVFGIVAVVLLGLMYPVNAIDLFIYAVRSRLLTHYGDNPNAIMPVAHPRDAWHGLASEWGNDRSPYGPLWNLIAAPFTAVAGDRIGVALFGYKLLAGVSVIVGALLCGAISETREAGTRAFGVLFYLWNPLVLWEGVGNGHNDVVMVVPVLAAVLAWQRGRLAWVIPLLVAAGSIKYVGLLLVPVALIALLAQSSDWPSRWRLAGRSAAGALAVALVALYPFYDLGALRESVKAQSEIMMTSPSAMALGIWGPTHGFDTVKPWARGVGAFLFVVVAVAQLAFTYRRPDRLPRAMFETLFAYLAFASFTFRGWYVIWLVALAAGLRDRWPSARTIAWSATTVFVYGLYIWGWEWWKVDFLTLQNAAVPLMFGPPLLLSLAELAWYGRRAFEGSPPPRRVSALPR